MQGLPEITGCRVSAAMFIIKRIIPKFSLCNFCSFLIQDYKFRRLLLIRQPVGIHNISTQRSPSIAKI